MACGMLEIAVQSVVDVRKTYRAYKIIELKQRRRSFQKMEHL